MEGYHQCNEGIDIISKVEGYYQYIGGYSVLLKDNISTIEGIALVRWRVFRTVEEISSVRWRFIISTIEGISSVQLRVIISTLEGYLQYSGGL